MHTVKKPYKQGLCREFIQTVYENFLKKLWEIHRKKTLKKEEDDSCFSRSYIFSQDKLKSVASKNLFCHDKKNVLAKMIYPVCRL